MYEQYESMLCYGGGESQLKPDEKCGGGVTSRYFPLFIKNIVEPFSIELEFWAFNLERPFGPSSMF